MINYILQVVLFQLVFLAIYDVFLSKETFFNKNRGYLLSTPVVSFLLPFIKIPSFQEAVPPEMVIYLPELLLSPEKVLETTHWYASFDYIDLFFGIGVIVFSVLFVVKLSQIVHFINAYKTIKKENYTLVLLPKQSSPFSFFNYIFLGEDTSETQKENIIAHELVHSSHKHSIDLLFFEVLKIMMWFNPMVYVYQKRITLVHEYISDEIVVHSTPKETYINELLSSFFKVENITFINHFYKQTFIKKRIIMMTKTQSKKMNQLKYLVLIPVLASMLFYTSCANSEKSNENELVALKKENKQLKDSILDFHSQLNVSGDRVPYTRDTNITNTNNSETTEVTEFEDGISFMIIDKAPTFPGCESGDKDCFSKMVQKHFSRNFDTKLPQQLGLASGKKRIFIGFKINKEGNIVSIKARAPHKKLEQEVLRTTESLPQMIPGEHQGKKIDVKYAIPFTLMIE